MLTLKVGCCCPMMVRCSLSLGVGALRGGVASSSARREGSSIEGWPREWVRTAGLAEAVVGLAILDVTRRRGGMAGTGS